MSSYSREAGQPMSTEHKRPLLAFVAVFVVAIVVVAGAARSDALRQFVQERTVDVVASTTLDLVGESEPETPMVEPEADATGAEPASLPAQAAQAAEAKATRGVAAKDRAAKDRAAKDRAGHGKAKGLAHAKAPGKAKGHAHAKAPGTAKGHAHAQPPGTAQGAVKASRQARGHTQGEGHHKARGKGHTKHGH